MAERDQAVERDDRGQIQPANKDRAQQTSSRKQRGESDPPLASDGTGSNPEEPEKNTKPRK
jgi:hypothetical protein